MAGPSPDFFALYCVPMLGVAGAATIGSELVRRQTGGRIAGMARKLFLSHRPAARRAFLQAPIIAASWLFWWAVIGMATEWERVASGGPHYIVSLTAGWWFCAFVFSKFSLSYWVVLLLSIYFIAVQLCIVPFFQGNEFYELKYEIEFAVTSLIMYISPLLFNAFIDLCRLFLTVLSRRICKE
jgi:hypothetical protein